MTEELNPRAQALTVLRLHDPVEKCNAVFALQQRCRAASDAAWQAHWRVCAPDDIPGRPAQPMLVSPRELERRRLDTISGRAILLHALAHIEFNAINLALDAIWRFADLPSQFYVDWLRVAVEEAQHFTLLNNHLQTAYATQYGMYPAHDGLWEMTARTADDVLARMALVPRTLEARGLDVTPAIRSKLAQAGDLAAAEILDIILRDEIGHVAIGNHWYSYCCQQRGLDPVMTFAQLQNKYNAPAQKGPFNLVARRAAGFTEEELQRL